MKIAAGLLVLALAATAAPAFAADPLAVPPAAAPMYDWNGVYVGVQLGGQMVNFSSPDPVGFVQPSGTGFVAGVHAGYNKQMNTVVLGVEGDVEYSSFAAAAPCQVPAFTCSTNLTWDASLRGRLGVTAGKALLYLTGGVAAAGIGGATNNGVNFPDSSVRFGLTGGAGVEMGFTDKVRGRIEYRATSFGARDMNYDIVYPGIAVATQAIRVGISVGM